MCVCVCVCENEEYSAVSNVFTFHYQALNVDKMSMRRSGTFADPFVDPFTSTRQR